MAGDPRPRTRRRAAWMLLTSLGTLLSGAAARAQEPGPARDTAMSTAAREVSLFFVNDSTTVHDLEFDIQGQVPWSEAELRSTIALYGPKGLDGLRRALAWVPLIKGPEPIPFDPVTLQMDVVRLRRFLVEGGFPTPSVDYRVRLDTVPNTVDVTMTLDPGRPRLLEGVELELSGEIDGRLLDPPALRATLLEGWAGSRVGDLELRELTDRTVAWARARGFAFAQVEVELSDDDDPFTTTATVRLEPGPVTTVGRFELENHSELDSATIMGHLLVSPGDTIRYTRLDESAKQLEQLSLVDAALVQVIPEQTPTATPGVRVLVLEGRTRAVSGRGGYSDNRGIISEARFEHRDFLGGGRTLRAFLQAETGIWSFNEFPDELYGVTVSLTQPRVGTPRLDLIPSLSWSYENGAREEARQLSTDLTLVLRRGPNRFISLTTRVYERDIIRFRGVDVSTLGLLEWLGQLEGLLGSSFRTSITLAASWGTRDDLANPRRGWLVNGSLGVTGPDPWSDVQFLRGDLSGAWLHEFSPGGLRILARGRVGRMFPFGRSRMNADDPLEAWLGLGSATFTSGGVESVRGFATDLLGPKVPEIRVATEPDTVLVPGDIWVPLGGLARWGVSGEVQLPLGARSQHYGMLFVDGARVHTPDAFFREEVILPLDWTDGAFFTVGGGFALRTPVGDLRMMMGYKLNPSPLDLRGANRVAQELLTEPGDRDPAGVPENPWRRFRFHVSLGQPF